MARVERDRVRTENELRRAEALVARLRGVSLDESAQALKDHAHLMRVSVVDVAHAVLSSRAVVHPARRVSRRQLHVHDGRSAT
jgi:hypothetical protein